MKHPAANSNPYTSRLSGLSLQSSVILLSFAPIAGGTLAGHLRQLSGLDPTNPSAIAGDGP